MDASKGFNHVMIIGFKRFVSKIIRKKKKAPEEHNIMKVTMKNRNKMNKVNKVIGP